MQLIIFLLFSNYIILVNVCILKKKIKVISCINIRNQLFVTKMNFNILFFITITSIFSKILQGLRVTKSRNIFILNFDFLSISGVPFPPAQRLTIPEVFDQRTNKPKPDILKQHFILEGRIDESAALKIINEGAALLRSEKTMVDIEAPVTG